MVGAVLVKRWMWPRRINAEGATTGRVLSAVVVSLEIILCSCFRYTITPPRATTHVTTEGGKTDATRRRAAPRGVFRRRIAIALASLLAITIHSSGTREAIKQNH